jgi:DNA-binding transcriptional ArsR family regulator
MGMRRLRLGLASNCDKLYPMLIGQTVDEITTEVAAGTGFALLVALAAASRRPREEVESELAAALDGVGDTEGEVWLNLFGVALDAGPPYDAETLRLRLGPLDGRELRRHILGRYAWSWCTLAGVDDIESAAAGDEAAAGRLLAQPRYYGGHARASLSVLLPLDPAETRERVLRAVDAAAATLLEETAAADLQAAEHAAAAKLATSSPLTAIERLTTGYRYRPEPEAERVVLIPHVERELPLVLAQHRSARLIVYKARRDRSGEERVLALGRALADPKRVEILGLVGRGVGRASDLVEETGLSRSTVHHHLAQLREAGLVALEGNARAYAYVPRRAAAADAAALIEGLIETEEES